MEKVNLLDHRWDKYTTTGNDGIIDFIIKTLKMESGFFVEFGAWDGIQGSNCRRLFEDGWGGIFIELDSKKYKELKNNYRDCDRISCIKSKVGLDKKYLFDNIVGGKIGNGRIDFCSIDIDGLDLEVFETFHDYLPTCVCIEGGQMLHPYHKRIKKSLAGKNIQQSLKVMTVSFEEKGYKLLCSYQDSFFVKKEFYKYFNVKTDLMELYLDGLRALYRRMPFIYQYVKKAGLKNPIVNKVLKDTNYFSYGYSKRKEWSTNMADMILESIDRYEKENSKN
jgi:hypothetical protein